MEPKHAMLIRSSTEGNAPANSKLGTYPLPASHRSRSSLLVGLAPAPTATTAATWQRGLDHADPLDLDPPQDPLR